MNTIIVRPDDTFYEYLKGQKYENFISLNHFETMLPENGTFLIRPENDITKKEIEKLSKSYPNCEFICITQRSYKINGFITKEWKQQVSPLMVYFKIKNKPFTEAYKTLCNYSKSVGIILKTFCEDSINRKDYLEILELYKYQYKIDSKMILAMIARKVCKDEN